MSWFRRRVGPADQYDNRSFWNSRYRTDPRLGSGVGSRGELAARKRTLVERVWEAAGRPSVLDVGFGDLEMLDVTIFPEYTGVDVSDVAVQNALARYPGRTFIRADFGADTDPDVGDAGMVLCLDVLIHQLDAEVYRRLVTRLVRRSRSVGLLSGYDSEPEGDFASDITAYHEPLSVTLSQAGACRVVRVDEYRGLSVFMFQTDPDAVPVELTGWTS